MSARDRPSTWQPVGRRAFLRNSLFASSTLVGYGAIPVFLDACGSPLEPVLVQNSDQTSASASITQSIVVKNAATGANIVGASVAVDDGLVCWVPKLTNTSGQVTFTTAGLRYIWVRCSGYAEYALALSSSSLSYNVSMTPLPSTPKQTKLSSTLANATRILLLASTFGIVKSVGRYSLQQIDYGIDTIAAGTFVTCLALSGGTAAPACTAAEIALGVAGTALWLAQTLGVPQTTEFDFYLMPTLPLGLPSLLILPAGT